MKVVIKNVERVFDEFLKIDRAIIQYEKFDGTMTDDVVRFNMNRGDSVAALLINRDTNCLIFTRQFRYAVYSHDLQDGWLLEIVAGIIENGDEPTDTIIKEIYEEVGYRVDNIAPLFSFYSTPGSNSEKIYLFYVEVTHDLKIASGGGLDDESEDIQVVEIPISEAFDLIDRNEIIDAKTIIALQWLKAQHHQ
ncbi:NUDIX hydrolase [candidate division KSB1 bacterium]|nr:NUDIX hydrolase [candidate division KSB1 bacterium]